MVAPASATLLATIPWAPAGPLPRRFVPVRLSSIKPSGPMLLRSAPSRVRTLPDGAVCVLSAPDEESGRCAALHVDAGHVGEPVRIGPERSDPGWQIIDFLGGGDGRWTVLELLPGPPDRVEARGIAPDGTTIWRSGATAGSPEALRQLLPGADSVLAVSDLAPRRLVAIDAEGTIADVQALADADGDCFTNGRGQLGFVGFDQSTEARSWVTLDIGDDPRHSVALAAESAWGLDLPLGMDALGRPYGNRQGTLVRFGADGRPDWELEAGQLVVEGDDVWISQAAESGHGIVAIPLTPPERAPAALDPEPEGTARPWRLAGLTRDAFVLHERSDDATPGTLATVAADGSRLDTSRAPEDVWLRWFDLQLARGAAVTDDGEIDLATRGPDALHIVRVTPAS